MTLEEKSKFIESTTAALKPLYKSHTHATWESATTGSDQAAEAEKNAQAELMRFWADRDRFEEAKRLDQDAGKSDPEVSRQIRLIFLAASKAQQDEKTIEKLTELETEVRQTFYNYRAVIEGETLSDNELDRILKESIDSAEVQTVWEASKELGKLVEKDVRELARVRNEAAQAQGYRDHFHKSLQLNEIDEGDLLNLFNHLGEVSQSPFEELKAEIDSARAQHFGIPEDQLMPWHYGDRFFQTAPDLGDYNTDIYYEDKDPQELAVRTYDGLGLEVRDILLRSDLHARPGKNQHAFCIDMDREGDVRTLNNLEANQRWTTTLLHELGHAVYDKYIDQKLPWILHKPPHALSTEAIALMMGSLTSDTVWLYDVLQVPEDQATQIAEHGLRREKAGGLIFTRWCLVMTNFERALYANPDGDLNSTWWDLVEEYQLLNRPEGRNSPDWAAKYHIPLVPVYYQNYELGMLVSAQFRHYLEMDLGNVVGQIGAGEWLVDRVFKTGALEDWSKHVESVSGEALNPEYFIQTLRRQT